MGFYELTKGRHMRNNRTLGVGDILEMTEEKAEQIGLHRLRYIGEELNDDAITPAKKERVPAPLIKKGGRQTQTRTDETDNL